jgi:hypothetical protein
MGLNVKSWKSKLKSTASDAGTILSCSILPSGFNEKVA